MVFPVKSVAVEYRAPAKLDDELKLTAAVERIGRASMQFKQEIWRISGEEPTLLAEGHVTVVCVNLKTFSSCAIPDDIRQKIQTQA